MEFDAAHIGLVGIISLWIVKECFAFARNRGGDGITRAESEMISRRNELLIHQKRTVGLLEKLVEKS